MKTGRKDYSAAGIVGILALSWGLTHSASAQSPFDPVTDDPRLPRLLLIGDSISIGYTLPVRRLLEGKANVHRIPVNGAYSANGLAHIREWLGDARWDVIHFNWGIWDTHLLTEDGTLLTDKDEAEGTRKGTIRTTVDQYQKNLNELVDIMQSTGARLIWASSTPLTRRVGSRLKDIDRYNAAAAEVMRARGIPINDLNAFVAPHLRAWQGEDGCHFTPEGSERLGTQVAKVIMDYLGPD
ncbi:MAG: SGNH/GDSL hydrolase family protein [Acidobacteriota bacterium]